MFGIIAFLVVILMGMFLPQVFVAVGTNPRYASVYILFGLYMVMYLIYLAIFFVFARLKLKSGENIEGGSYKNLIKEYNFRKPRVMDLGIVIIIALISILAFMMLQNGLEEVFNRGGFSSDGPRLEMENFGHYVLLVIIMAVMPAIVEELLFRGLILHSFMPFGKIVAIFASSLLFSLFHLNPTQTVYQFFLGMVMAIVYLRTKNMWYPILLHFVNNFAIITFAYITQGMNDGYVIWNWQLVLSMWVLVIVGTLIVLNLVKLLRSKDSEPRLGVNKFIGTKEFGGFMACMLICMVIWVIVFVG